MQTRLIAALSGFACLMLLFGVWFVTLPQPIDAQQNRAAQFATNAAATARAFSTNAASTSRAFSTSAASTAAAFSTNAASTAAAFGTNARATVTAFSGDSQATIRAFSTALAGDLANLQPTATALSATLQAAIGELPDEIEALLLELAGAASYVYDPTTGTLTLTTYVQESTANAAIDALLQQAGYSASTFDINMQSPDLVTFTLLDPTTGIAYAITYQVVVIDGEVIAQAVSAAVNARSVPLDAVPDELLVLGENSIEIDLTGEYEASTVSYSVQSVTIDDNGALIIVTIELE